MTNENTCAFVVFSGRSHLDPSLLVINAGETAFPASQGSKAESMKSPDYMKSCRNIPLTEGRAK